MQARLPPSQPPTVWKLTALVRLQSKDRAGPVALKSTPSSQAIPQPPGTALHFEANYNSAVPAQPASAAPVPQLESPVQAQVLVQHPLAAISGSGIAQQHIQHGEPVRQSSARTDQIKAGSRQSRQGIPPEHRHVSSAYKEQPVVQSAVVDDFKHPSDRSAACEHNGHQKVSCHPQPSLLEGNINLSSRNLPQQQNSSTHRQPEPPGHALASEVCFQSYAAQHSPSQASTMAYTGATQASAFPLLETQMPASPLRATQPPAGRPEEHETAAEHRKGREALLQRGPQPLLTAEQLDAASQVPHAASHEGAGPSNSQVSRNHASP